MYIYIYILDENHGEYVLLGLVTQLGVFTK